MRRHRFLRGVANIAVCFLGCFVGLSVVALACAGWMWCMIWVMERTGLVPR